VTHVFIIVLENQGYRDLIGNDSTPYLSQLAARYSVATEYFAITRPSLPNYLALTAGSTFGVRSDATNYRLEAPNIADQVEQSGRSWKAYMEDMPRPCYTGPTYGGYALKHNPFLLFANIRDNPTRCASHVVPFTQFSKDLAANQVPNYVWITPNMCHDMHDCASSVGDQWLSQVVPSILNSSAWRNGGFLAIVTDEGTDTQSPGGHAVAVIATPTLKPGREIQQSLNHYGLLATIEDLWHLPRLANTVNVASLASLVMGSSQTSSVRI
jgi:hypothetical protein